MTLKQSQGHQTQIENVDPIQGDYHKTFERGCNNSVQGKRLFFFFKRGNMSIISHEHV